MTKSIFYIVVGLLFFQNVNAQKEKETALQFQLKFEESPLEFRKTYISKNQDTLQISTFKCYISGLQLHYADQTVFTEPNSFHLLDGDAIETLSIPIVVDKSKEITKVVFNIGIDSTTSVSGALAGDLDPTKGMYWAWQSGYINMKLEGKSSSCKTRKNEFQFHIGGYKQPYYALRKIELFLINQKLLIAIDVAELFSEIQLSETNTIMIPGKKAMEIADKSLKMFKTE
ncbi:MAG: MbnP family protein [Bacteroidota bacterium]